MPLSALITRTTGLGLGNDFLEAPCDEDWSDVPGLISDEEADRLVADPFEEGDPVVSFAGLRAAVAGRDLSIANRLRGAGLQVKEVDGWRSRGDAVLSPKGLVTHHTAGPRDGETPTLSICINGRSDLRGPLCNVYLSRSGVWYVVASGRANHAGLGGHAGLTGNSSVLGVECEHPGTFPMPDVQVVSLTIGVAALIERRIDNSKVCQHWEWSTSGKIDIATNFHQADDPRPYAAQFRRMVGREVLDLAKVEKSKIVYPSGTRKPNGDWVRRSVIVATERVDEWLEGHPGVLQRRGPGSDVLIADA